MGLPRNGKTMACRWLADQCRRRGLDWRNVSGVEFDQASRPDEVQAQLDSATFVHGKGRGSFSVCELGELQDRLAEKTRPPRPSCADDPVVQGSYSVKAQQALRPPE